MTLPTLFGSLHTIDLIGFCDFHQHPLQWAIDGDYDGDARFLDPTMDNAWLDKEEIRSAAAASDAEVSVKSPRSASLPWTTEKSDLLSEHTLHQSPSGSTVLLEKILAKSNEPVSGRKPCHCKRSHCQKKYCECYGNGVACTNGCKCQQCENSGNNTVVAQPKRRDRCRCKKTNCVKKYCECYASGVGCGVACRCTGCMNVHEEQVVPNTQPRKKLRL